MFIKKSAVIVIIYAYLCISSISSFKLSLKTIRRSKRFLSTLTDININSLTYDVKAWKRGYETCEKEICEIIGNSLPTDIEGTYFR